ncbi:hypothetical protein K6V98_07295 [Collinsella sp. AGMB00827]|uniref:ABC transporter permease n=1 Tax=Collinsella ureilytica TaxID=2869515 RepID=A0ABS7MLG4_9ACTN|nr:hypothetical protein [Collinsella urealyticum]MBY4798148.1 hypothetical protein [Collinsella urealyticum]
MTTSEQKGPAQGIAEAQQLMRSWFFGGSWSAALAWAVLVVSLITVLAWFFIASPYGAPAAPVYAEF